MEKTWFELCIKISDVVLVLRSEEEQDEFAIDHSYQKFLAHEIPQVILTHRQQKPPSLDSWEKYYDSQGVWQLYRKTMPSGTSHAIALFSPVSGSAPYRVGIFTSDFSSGEIFSEFGYTNFPLAYPMAELIIIHQLSQGRGLLLHACGVKDGERGYLFSGVSGAGKSTTANLWEKQAGVTLLSDDRVILQKKGDAFWIYGTPWHGDARAASPEGVRLDKVFIVNHGKQNRLAPLKPIHLISRLLSRAFPPFWDAAGMDYTLGLLAELSQAVPGYDFDFLPDPSAVEFIKCSPAL